MNYVCSVEAGCNETFIKFVDLKSHEAAHSPDGYICQWPSCNFATLIKNNYDIHYAKHTGEQRYICPHNCDYKTHDPALFTRHRKKFHGYVPLVRGRGVPSATGSGRGTQASSPQPQAQAPALSPSFQFQPQPSASSYQFQVQPAQFQPIPAQFQPQPAQFQPIPTQFQPQPPRLTQFQPQLPRLTPFQPSQFLPQGPMEYQPDPVEYQPPQADYTQLLGVLYGPTDTVDDYTIYTGAAKAPHGWTEGCMCPELMERRLSEVLEL
ncbi:hypothetical protein EV702DRAFT_631581 [Suillus placidus]|uniref:C2H2-type domain-containing protein n=1 Tax=Suillus placidus TaxID=48579 RepID=A0A9P6ZM61_9AGAM|nr:hypothetical protein EV702DRAFT_631581 [Suillus placidus]